jgi:hypothetical protein
MKDIVEPLQLVADVHQHGELRVSDAEDSPVVARYEPIHIFLTSISHRSPR